MTIKQCMADAAQGARFSWWWIGRKPGILFLKSSAHPEHKSIHEVYTYADAIRLIGRIVAKGGQMDMFSLEAAVKAQQEFLANREASHARHDQETVAAKRAE